MQENEIYVPNNERRKHMDTLNPSDLTVTPPRGVPSRFDSIPIELRRRDQWVVWRAVEREGKITKPPFNPNRPYENAEVNDPATWGTFDEAVHVAATVKGIAGIGFVFTADDPYFGIDIDDIEKVPPQFRERRQALERQIHKNTTSYVERSPSGKGIHIIAKGKLPFDGKKSTPLQLEVYHNKRFFTMTGDVVEYHDPMTGEVFRRDTITDQQDLADEIAASMPQREAASGGALTDTTDGGRRLDLRDEEVLYRARQKQNSFSPRFDAQQGHLPGEWSDTFIAVVGTLDEVSGSVEQVRRIIMGSPLVLNAPPTTNGETRAHKAARNFGTVLARVRPKNTPKLRDRQPLLEHGRQLREAFEKTEEERMQVSAEDLDRLLDQHTQLGGRSITSAFMLDHFWQIPDHYKRALTAPPGMVGHYVEAAMRASKVPFLRFAIPATLATLSGIIGRRYKLGGKLRTGTALNIILAAPSGAGKGQSITPWRGFVRAAYDAAYQNTPTKEVPKRMSDGNGASSIQGVMNKFIACPAGVWIVDECGQMLNSMANPRSNTDYGLRDSYNNLHDFNRHDAFFSAPHSREANKSGETPVNNISQSTFWTLPVDKFQLRDGDALDGFLARTLVIRHNGAAGSMVPDREIVRDLPDWLRDRLKNLLLDADNLDAAYEYDPNAALPLLTEIGFAHGVEDLVWALEQQAEIIVKSAQNGHTPKPYVSLNRVAVIAKRIAGTLAVLENPFIPEITVEQYQWSFGYVLQCFAHILSDFDTGEIGDKVDDEWLCTRAALIDLLKADKDWRKNGGVPLNKLRDKMKNQKTFKNHPTQKSDERVSKALRRFLEEDGYLIENKVPSLKRGRPTTYINLADTD
ncbi:hypothetical protein ACSBOB_19575 [Mesorhizobium sp. ASY16-5R]|uniref:hypothetical protein n=1 Tax=Mesorhizobium sp. ASY16-5R TaxID=3445772 RepID=UPI003F9F8AD2